MTKRKRAEAADFVGDPVAAPHQDPAEGTALIEGATTASFSCRPRESTPRLPAG
jgi:hypothetical protein